MTAKFIQTAAPSLFRYLLIETVHHPKHRLMIYCSANFFQISLNVALRCAVHHSTATLIAITAQPPFLFDFFSGFFVTSVSYVVVVGLFQVVFYS